MRSRLCKRHFTGNGYGFDAPWRDASQQGTATDEAIFLCYEWLNGRERVQEFQDAIFALIEMYGDDIKPACRKLWVASLSRIYENEDMKLRYFEAGMEEATKIIRRRSPHLQTGWEHHNNKSPLA